MNLALLDPFRRTVPDRIDSTLTLPQKLHPLPPSNSKEAFVLRSKSNAAKTPSKKRKKSSSPASASKKKDGDSSSTSEGWNEWYSCSVVSFNRRGTYIAAGHLSGIVAYHDFGSRTLSSIFVPDVKDCEVGGREGEVEDADAKGGVDKLFANGITSLSWSRRSRCVLLASLGDKRVCLVDNTHPFGVRDAFRGLATSTNSTRNNGNSKKSKSGTDMDISTVNSLLQDDASLSQGECESQSGLVMDKTSSTSRKEKLARKKDTDIRKKTYEYKHTLYIPKMMLLQPDKVHDEMGNSSSVGGSMEGDNEDVTLPQYQALVMALPEQVGACVQIHPGGIGGLACLQDGSLVLFRFPLNGFQSSIHNDSESAGKLPTAAGSNGVYIYLSRPGFGDSDDATNENHVKSFHIACASFHGRGDCIYAATTCGKLLYFQLNEIFRKRMFVPRYHSTTAFSDVLQKYSCFDLEDNCVVGEIVSSRNGQMIVLNCTDCLKLYNVNDVSEEMSSDEMNWKPRFVFQDVVSKVKWHACDFSGDGEYVVGGCNNNESGNKYELYFWNTATGILIDQLTGPQIHLNSLSWHPTRSFIAVGTSDGIVDIWGPRMDWTAYAPDFQALQRNVEYIEKEDEFDVVIDCDIEAKRKEMLDMIEDQVVVDVTTVDKVLAFDSDSEDEEEVFYFHQDISTLSN